MSDARLLVALVDELVMGRGFDIRGFHDVVLGSGETAPAGVVPRGRTVVREQANDRTKGVSE
ncbi:hypothetical protein [Amycolatopsis palatopharyngis]|uniref:hypothetical protein n=1 Tax=Amycolatopsis palatopharyngis TaxID=187982 RepID=UPI000E21E18C|nr:hypothetical protein [Amycolatopsis palatopharyngis]